jgi:hypothetical protein
MRRSVHLCMFVGVAVLLAVSGCQKVEQNAAKTLDPGDVLAPIIVSAPNRDQALSLVVKPSGAVDVYICSEEDGDAAVKNGKAPQNPYAKQMGVDKETTITATAPAKKGYAVVLAGAKKPKTNVDLKLSAK